MPNDMQLVWSFAEFNEAGQYRIVESTLTDEDVMRIWDEHRRRCRAGGMTPREGLQWLSDALAGYDPVGPQGGRGQDSIASLT